MRLSEYLSKHDISVADFAAQIGVTGEAVRLYMLGKRTPRREHMQAIVKATKGEVAPNDFLAEHAEPQVRAS